MFTPTALTMNERSESSYTVALATEPTADVTGTIDGFGSLLLLSSGGNSELTFTMSNWNTPQTVPLTALGDQNLIQDMVTLTHTASGGGYGAVTKNLVVTITDGGGHVSTVPLESQGGMNVNEGDSANLKVQLNPQPTGDVTVTISGHVDNNVTLSTESLTFTTDNWNTQQTVSVTAKEDADGYDDKVTLSLSAVDGGYDGVTRTYTVTIVDADFVDVGVRGTRL